VIELLTSAGLSFPVVLPALGPVHNELVEGINNGMELKDVKAPTSNIVEGSVLPWKDVPYVLLKALRAREKWSFSTVYPMLSVTWKMLKEERCSKSQSGNLVDQVENAPLLFLCKFFFDLWFILVNTTHSPRPKRNRTLITWCCVIRCS